MKTGSPYALVEEMLDAPDVLRRFDAASVAPWAAAVDAKKRLLLTGEGSSRIFPAKNLVSLAAQFRPEWQVRTEGARQAAEYDLSGYVVMAASNSGRTREVIALFEKLAKDDVPRYCVTGAAGTPLAALSTDARVLACGTEKAVPASKSVIEQALVFHALAGGPEWHAQAEAADRCAAVLAQDVSAEIIAAVKDAPTVYFAGRNDGVAEELALKANEITRQKSFYLEGTYVLHGIEESMRADETVVLVNPYKDEIAQYQKVLRDGVGIRVVAIAPFDTPFPTFRVPELPGFDGYFQLMAGWNILASAGIASGTNIDKPARVRKAGNAVAG